MLTTTVSTPDVALCRSSIPSGSGHEEVRSRPFSRKISASSIHWLYGCHMPSVSPLWHQYQPTRHRTNPKACRLYLAALNFLTWFCRHCSALWLSVDADFNLQQAQFRAKNTDFCAPDGTGMFEKSSTCEAYLKSMGEAQEVSSPPSTGLQMLINRFSNLDATSQTRWMSFHDHASKVWQ